MGSSASKRLIILVVFIITTVGDTGNNAYCFDDTITHPKLTERAVDRPVIKDYLINQLGFSEGFDKKISPYGLNENKKIIEWLQKGSTDEDSPMCRASTHFHNPLLPWDQSYMTDAPWWINMWCRDVPPVWPQFSNITWATGYTSRGGSYTDRDRQDMGWKDARTYFYQALTTTTPVNRDDYFVKAFRAVGQVLHLLEDMAVPAHVRNDFQSHLNFNGIKENDPMNPISWFGNPFEYYVKLNPGIIAAATPAAPKFINPMLTDFWDTNQTGTITGLAEFTNANYFSDQTIPGNNIDLSDPYYPVHIFPLPQLVNGTYDCVDMLPEADNLTRYVSRTPCLVPYERGKADHFVAYSFLTSEAERKALTANQKLRKYVLDDNVHYTYATEPNGLLSKAVGYSAALLDYLFRGKLEASFSTLNPSTSSTMRLMLNNATPDAEMTGGKLALVLRYHHYTDTGTTLTPPAQTTDFSYMVIELPTQTVPSGTATEFAFTLSQPLPLWTKDLAAQVVYQGTLGNESNAVAVSQWTPLQYKPQEIALELPAAGVYASTSGSSPFNEIRLNVRNNLSSGETMTDGTMSLYLLYRTATSDPFQSLPVDVAPSNGGYSLLKVPEKSGIRSIPAGSAVELAFDLSAAPLPLWATDVYLYVVYQGTLIDGVTTKTNATVIGKLDISEPTPVDVFNNADKICINKSWYTAGSPDAITLSAPELFDPYAHNIDTIFAKDSSTASLASSSNYTFSSPNVLAGGSFRRVGYILTDYSFNYSFLESWINTDQNDPWTTIDGADQHPGTAVKNQTDADGNYTWPGMYTMRGNKMWWGASVIWDNDDYQSNPTCDWSTLP